jgi:pseudouridine-5'-phosphate glycosidase/pseudouridine kinase
MLALLRKRLVDATQKRIRSISTIPKDNNIFRISEEVREALHSNKPVVALETTIYTHGFPYPDNLALSSYLESVVRENGGVPATIGILDGVARVGLSPEEIIRLCASKGPKTLKLSRRDLAFATASSLAGSSRVFHGGSTISGTMILAKKAGIKVFATGGLGGVHRGGEKSLDISADLTELGRTPVAVIASGCKGFLDIPRTLEYLETQGVGVATFADGRDITKRIDFPAFWARDSGSKSPMVIENEAHAAAMICKTSHTYFAALTKDILDTQGLLGLQSGLFLANPIPESSAIPNDEMNGFIEEAIRFADSASVSGSDNTPFVLQKIKEITRGKSVEANRVLVAANVKRGTLVAQELTKLESMGVENR